MGAPHKHRDVIIAWANGEEIECRMAVGREWMPCTQTTHQFSNLNEYRIKPRIVKREGWTNIGPSRDCVAYVGSVYESIQEADLYAHDRIACIRIEWEEEV